MILKSKISDQLEKKAFLTERPIPDICFPIVGCPLMQIVAPDSTVSCRIRYPHTP